jgi:hypothetical protein
MTGSDIRHFFRELFGSRLVERLEEDLVRLRADFENRLQDKESIIANLREEKQQLIAKVNLYELTIMPRASAQGAEVVAYSKPTKPNFSKEMFMSPPAISNWQRLVMENDLKNAKELEEERKAKETKSV